MSDWSAASPSSAQGFDERICKSLLEELDSCVVLFTKFLDLIGTREDTRDLRGKISATRTKGTDAASRLKGQLSQPVKQAQGQARKDIVQQAQDSMTRFADISQKLSQKQGEVVAVMRESLNSGKPVNEIVRPHSQFVLDPTKLKEIDVDNQLLVERNKEVEQVGEVAKDLFQVAKDLQNQVQADTPNLTTAAGKAASAADKVDDGEKEIVKASEYGCAAKWKMFVIIGIIITVVAVAIIIGVVVGVRNNAPPPVAPPV